MSVRTNWVDSSFALLNGAPTFLTLVGGLDRPHEVTIQLPAAWKTTMSGMDEPSPHHYVAPDYDTLVDSPIVAGNPDVRQFEIDGVPHFLVTVGGEGTFDGERAMADLENIVRRYREMWGGLPYRNRYVFLNLLTEAGAVGWSTGIRSPLCRAAGRRGRARPMWAGWIWSRTNTSMPGT